MKIAITLPTRTKIGNVHTEVDVYFSRPEYYHLDGYTTRGLYRLLPKEYVLLDYDFQAARRALAAGRLTLKSLAAVTVFPVAGAALIAGGIMAQAASVLWDLGADVIDALRDELPDLHNVIVEGLKREWAELTA